VTKQHSGEGLFVNRKGNVSRRALLAMKLVTQMPSSILVIKTRFLAFIAPLAVGSIAAFFLYFRIPPVAMVGVILIGMALPGDPPSDACAKLATRRVTVHSFSEAELDHTAQWISSGDLKQEHPG